MNFKEFIKNKLFGSLVLVAFLALAFFVLSVFSAKEQKKSQEQKAAKESLSASVATPQVAAPKIEEKLKEPKKSPGIETKTNTPSTTDKKQVNLEGFEGLQEESQEVENLPAL